MIDSSVPIGTASWESCLFAMFIAPRVKKALRQDNSRTIGFVAM